MEWEQSLAELHVTFAVQLAIRRLQMKVNLWRPELMLIAVMFCLQRLFRAADISDDGKITRTEFLTAMSCASEEEIR